MAELDRIRVVVEPDTTGFQAELTKDLSKVDAEVPVDVDLTRARVTLQKFSSTASADPIDIPVSTDTTLARREVSTFRKTSSVPVDIPVHANTAGARTEMRSLNKVSLGVFKSISKGAVGLGLLAGAALGTLAAGGKEELLEADKVSRRSAALLKSTGLQAIISAKSVDAFSGSLLKKTGIDDQAIQSATNLFLANQNVVDGLKTNKQLLFDATEAAAGLAIVSGKGVPAAAKALNKALADPTKGIKGLERAQLFLSDAQKKSIADTQQQSGKYAAQAKLIQIVNDKTRDAAKANADSITGQLTILQEGIDGAGADILKKIVPTLVKVGTAIGSAFGEGGVITKFGKAISPLGPALKAIGSIFANEIGKGGANSADIFESIGAAATRLANAILTNLPAIRTFAKTLIDFAKTAIPVVIGNLRLFFNILKPFLPIVAGIVIVILRAATAFGNLVLKVQEFLRNSTTFQAIIETIAIVLGKVLKFVVEVLIASFNDIRAKVSSFITDIVVRVKTIIGAVVAIGKFLAKVPFYFKNAWAKAKLFTTLFIANITERLKGFRDRVKAFLVNTSVIIYNTIANAWTRAREATVSRINSIIAFVRALPGKIRAHLSTLGQAIITIAVNAFNGFRTAIVNRVTSVIQFLRKAPGRIVSVFKNVGLALANVGIGVIGSLEAGLRFGFQKVEAFVKTIAGIIKKLKGPIEADRKLLIPEGGAIMEGLGKGIKDNWKPVASNLAGIASEIGGIFQNPFGTAVGVVSKLTGVSDVLSKDQVDALNVEIGNVLVGEGSIKRVQDILENATLGGLHPSSGLADTKKQERILHKMLGIVGTTFKDGHPKYTASGNISDHWTGHAVDFGDATAGNDHANLDRAAKKTSELIDKVFKQIIWRNKFWSHGKKQSSGVSGHLDHLHLGWKHRKKGGRVQKNHAYRVGEVGEEGFIPDQPGFVVSNDKLMRLLSMGDRVASLEAKLRGSSTTSGSPVVSTGTVQENNFYTTLQHNVPNASTLLAVLEPRLESFARVSLASMAGTI